MIGYDVETTGVDMWHGCCPFAYSAVRDDGMVFWDQWDVDPYTREVDIPVESVEQLGNLLDGYPMVCHNAGFDMLATEIVFGHPGYEYEHTWDWSCIEDTLLAAHALRNLWPHDLKTLRSVFLKVGNRMVDLLEKSVKHAQRICRLKRFKEKHGVWRLAKKGDPHFPAAKQGRWWLYDLWLPATICRLAPEFLPSEHLYSYNYEYFLHPWENITRDYCIEDSMTTLVLWDVLRDALQQEGLWEQYLERKELLRVCYRTEQNGVHIFPNRLEDEVSRYTGVAERHKIQAVDMMKKRDADDPNINSDQQLRWFIYGEIGMPVKVRTEGGQPSTKAEVIESMVDDIPDHHWGKPFFEHLLAYRRNNKAADYLTSYEKWSTPNGRIADIYWDRETNGRTGGARTEPTVGGDGSEKATEEDYYFVPRWIGDRLHTSYRITGTKFTRQSTASPNLQNVGTGKEEGDEIDYRLRVVFGPEPGRFWYTIDYANIELRIWAYLCENREFIEAFEQNYSIHLLIAKELHPQLRKYHDTDDIPPELYPLYKRTKNGNFSIIYGANPYTANATYKVKDAYEKISSRFPEVKIFTKRLHREVKERGYVETLTGYRLWIPTEDPHIAVSGKIQGTAGSVIGRAMVNTQRVLDEYNTKHSTDGRLILQVHDELVFDFPNTIDLVDPDDEYNSLHNKLEDAMTCIGNDIGIPLAVDAKLITSNWAEGVAV